MQNLSTEDLANELKVRPGTILHAFSSKGHYLGLVPIKLPNRRLLWPADEVNALLRGEVAS